MGDYKRVTGPSTYIYHFLSEMSFLGQQYNIEQPVSADERANSEYWCCITRITPYGSKGVW